MLWRIQTPMAREIQGYTLGTLGSKRAELHRSTNRETLSMSGQLLPITDLTYEFLSKSTKSDLRALLEVLSESATNAAIANAVASLVNSSPATLDQLNELATALGNDPNFATTIASSLAGKQALNSNLTFIAGLVTQAWGRGLLTFADAAAFRTYTGTPIQDSVTDQVFSETITWTGTAAPGGTATTRFQWFRLGNLVFFQFRFEWTSIGTSITAAQFPFPAGFPAPAQMTGQNVSEVLLFANGGAGTSGLGGSSTGNISEARVQLNASGNLEARIRFAATTLGMLFFSGFYRCQP
jgi:hypothetical protein